MKHIKTYRVLALVLLCMGAVGVVWAQGPLTPFFNLRGRTDSNGYLLTSVSAYGASDGPLTVMGNLRVRTDANGYLMTTEGAASVAKVINVNDIKTTSTPGVTNANVTAADVVNTQQLAPSYINCGTAWKSNATAASEIDCVRLEARPATGAAATVATWAVSVARACATIATCSYTDVMVLDQNMGRLNMTGNILASASVSVGTTLTNGGIVLGSATAPTVTGFGTSPSVPAANGTYAFTINVGTGGAASTGTITLPTATTGWWVSCFDVTTPASFVTNQTGGTATTATVTNYSRTTGNAIAWTASDVLRCSAWAY